MKSVQKMPVGLGVVVTVDVGVGVAVDVGVGVVSDTQMLPSICAPGRQQSFIVIYPFPAGYLHLVCAKYTLSALHAHASVF